jgi:hypothetical protein
VLGVPISEVQADDQISVKNAQQQLDQRAALELIYQYSYNWDGKKPDGVANIFTEDCVWEALGPDGQPVRRLEGRKAFRDFAANRFITVLADRKTRHYKTNTVFLETKDNKIVARTMALIIHVVDGEDAPKLSHTAVVEHEFSNASGKWLIKRRSVLE